MKKLLALLLAVMMTVSMFAGLSLVSKAEDAGGPILHYSFEGNTNDVSGNAKNGTARNITYQNGINGQAAYFSGSSAYVTMPQGILKDADSAAVSWWFRSTRTNQNQWLWSIGNSSSSGYWFTSPRGTAEIRSGITLGTYSSENNAFSGINPSTSQWYHAVSMISNGRISLYINGELIASTATNIKPSSLGNTSGNYIGRSLYSADPYYYGYVDEFMIYDRALTDAEILILAGKTPPAITDVACNNLDSYELDKDTKTIKLNMLYSTDITSVAPSFTMYEDAAISPASGTARDFTQPQTYTVTTAEGEETWTVSVELLDPITAVSVENMVSSAAIDNDAKTIAIAVKDGTDVTKLAPEFTLSEGCSISPASGTERNFSLPQTYEITAGSKKETWTVTIRQVSINNPVLSGLYADPEIAVFNNRFYIYPTTDGYSGWNNTYMTCWSSPDLINWESHGIIMELGNEEFGAEMFSNSIWAPSVIEVDGYYYLFFSAKGAGQDARLTYGVSDKPEGPFVIPEGEDTFVSIRELGEQTIDSSVFHDPVSGNYYFYWGQGRMCMQQISFNNGKVIRIGSASYINKPTEYNEGTYVFYKKVNGEDRYYFTYSCNDTRSEDYKVRYCWANTPMPTASQLVYPENPILLQMPGLNIDDTIRGCGHGSPMNIPGTDTWYYAYHRMHNDNGTYTGYSREVCIDPMIFNEDGTLQQMNPSHAGITIPDYAVTVTADKEKAEKNEEITYTILTARDVSDVKLTVGGKDIALKSKSVETIANANYMPKKWTVTASFDTPGAKTIQAYTKTVNSEFTEAMGAKATVTISGMVDEDDLTGYLFAYFSDASSANSPSESIRFALSRDGMKFTPVNNNEAIVKSTVGQKGLRDPHIVRGVNGDYYMVATDLKTSGGWSNTTIVTYKSTDLVNWTDETLIKLTGITEGTDNCGRVWAPQAIYDSQRDEYMIYWSMGFGSHAQATAQGHSMNEIWYVYTKDFKTLTSDPAPLFVPSDLGSAIDADIIEYDGKFYMFFKYGDGGVTSQVAEGVGLKLTVSDNLTGPYTYDNNGKNFSPTIALGNGVGKSQVEGSGSYKLIGKNEWVLNYDCYQLNPKKYDGMLMTDLYDINSYTSISRDVYSIGGSPRHGAVIALTEEEIQAIQAAYGKVLEDLPEETIDPNLTVNGIADGTASAYINDPITISFTAAEGASRVGLLNENGKWLSKSSVEVVNNGDGSETWTVVVKSTSKGQRTISIYLDYGEDLVDTELDALVNMTSKPKTYDPRFIEIVSAPETAKINTPFEIIVKTNGDVSKIGLFNEKGVGISKIVVSAEKDTEGNIIWVLSTQVGSAGSRTFSVKVASNNSGWLDGDSFSATIAKR